ncbi:FACT complex subunit spt16 [Bacidia gigantensis]|uniref:FACT complex subunit spt16 n=1 Tax=Bacidia gigantensis TaxID=2732470 RepID=UPI001D03EBC6|nr:FACT complex subunit spt16 [Bacidia gigantensis]KAG8526310.1 FACT complex subunit spt16 [Bacidia gigantensis]
MAEEVKIDRELFHSRLSHLISTWKNDKRSSTDALFAGAGSIVIILGKNEEVPTYHKSNALHSWLLGYEFPATLMVFTPESLTVVTTAKKAKHLEALKGGKIHLEVLVRGKDSEENAKQFEKCLDVIKSAGKKVGTLPKDTAAGPFADEWKKALGDVSKDVEEVDISTALSAAAFSAKDETELRSMRNASRACTGMLTEYFVEEMSSILDEEKKVTHKSLQDKIDGKLDNPKFFKGLKTKLPSDFDSSQLDWAYGPTIQSGGHYDLKLSALSDDKNLHAGIIIAGLGLRYKSYASMVARTFMVDPNTSQEQNYKLLSSIQDMLIREAREGVVIRDLYNKAIALIKNKKPDLEKHFLKNIGGGVGFETRDPTLVINARNTRQLKDGMTLTLAPGFTDLSNPSPQDNKSKNYSLFLCDTVRVLGKQDDAANFTNGASSEIGTVSFYFKDEEEDEAPKEKSKKKDPKVGAVASNNIVKTKLRDNRGKQTDDGAEARRREHQKELSEKKQREGVANFSEATGDANGVQQKKFKKFESYKRDNQFPSRVGELAIVVDEKASTIVLPIMGRPVPFHINTVKNASNSTEGEFAYLRINFLSPGQGVGRKDDQPFEDPTAHFVRSLTFRSTDANRMSDIADKITNLRKAAVRREQEKKELEDVVEQDQLKELRHARPQHLDNCYVRPGLEGKRITGEVQIQANGLRYFDARGQRVDVLFSNIKHLFFQPCTHELIVIIHVHLKDPIMIGKKKAKDVQFYREATDMAFDETGNRKRKHRYGDEEEFEQEQEERRRRALLDKEFKNFAEKINAASPDTGTDIPFRELGFNGVPNRSNVLMQPTQDCLVQLTEPPFTVIPLDELEIVHLERVQFGLKNFDMVFVFKDFHRPPAHINTVPVEALENVKDWLDSVDISYSEGPLNLNWSTIMKTVTADTHQFFRDGGWSFLTMESDDEEEEEEDEESAYEMSESDFGASEESSADSEFDHDASADEGDASDDDESGEDWDELERKAKKKDREGGLDDEEKPKKKKK